MSRVKTAIHNNLQALELLRDELVLQTHLFRADLKSEWDRLERKRAELKECLGRAGVAASDSKTQIDAASQQLIDALAAGYTGIKTRSRAEFPAFAGNFNRRPARSRNLPDSSGSGLARAARAPAPAPRRVH